ncbi:MAG TPA: hypothetical protein VHF27_14100 [Acidimicrobiales bacterium]|nr:hypothetical protein [Acidimicrobiales bacterium]
MTQLTVPNPQDLQGQILYDAGGEGIGVIEGIYLDNATREPEWAAVRLGPDSLALVPLHAASVAPDGLRVEYDRQMVLAAPFRLTALDNEVTEDTEQQLYDYYEGGGGNGSRPAVVEEAQEVVEEAKDEAADVAAMARDEAADVAATARDEAADVASEAKEQARDVVSTAKEEAASVVELAREETSDVVQVAAAEARDMLDTTTTELESQAQVQLEEIATSLHRLAGQALALARGNAEQAGPLGDLVGRAGQELQNVGMSIEERGSAGLLSDVQQVVRRRPRAAIIGTAAAVVAGAKLMGTPAGERIKERLAPLKEQAVEAGKSVAEELKPIAQQRAEQVKAVATQAADQVKAEAQGTVQDVKGTAKQSTRTVKRTAKESATTVKGTAKQSSTAVKTTAKRSTRTAAPVG